MSIANKKPTKVNLCNIFLPKCELEELNLVLHHFNEQKMTNADDLLQ